MVASSVFSISAQVDCCLKFDQFLLNEEIHGLDSLLLIGIV